LGRRKLFLIGGVLLAPAVLLAHGVSSGDQAILDQGGLLAYVWVGAKHMLTGYDHLLFLAGVIFFLSGIRDVLKFITVFTIGHSIPLIGATYLGILADEHLVDAVIGFSVFYKGFENLGGFEKYFSKKPPNILGMVFLFGLIHGFGLSTRLQSFDTGTEDFLLKILSFNLGVELGQVIALIPLVWIIQKCRKAHWYPAFYKASNTYLLIAGMVLVGYQLWGYFDA
jgi:hypothetical protein